MSFTEVSEEGWFSRIGSSIKGILFGIILFALAFPVLFWNEGRAVRRAQSLTEGKGAVVSVSADKVDAANEGKLVHLWGMASTEGTLTDPKFAVAAENALRFERVVEMYQWDEDVETRTEKKAGGKKKTIKKYTYSKVWSDKAIDSSNFKETGRDNPGQLPYKSETMFADKISLGAFDLGEALAAKISGDEELPLTDDSLNKLSPSLAKQLKVSGNSFYQGANPSSPEIGDVRIKFFAIPPATVSVIAVQQGDTFGVYTAKAGGSTIFELRSGEVTAEEMFSDLESQNTTMTWVLRVVGFMMMVFGIQMVFKPLVVVADVIPFIGSFLETGIGLLSMTLAFPLALITVAIGWVFYRPVIGITIIVLALGIFFAGFKAMQSRKKG